MKFEEFIGMFDNYNGTTKVNDNDLNCIAKGNTWDIAHEEFLLDLEVVAFGFYDDELCVRVITGREEPKEFTCEDCPYHYYDEGEDYPSCHHTDNDLTAPCEYEEESWGYEDRNYNRLYD